MKRWTRAEIAHALGLNPGAGEGEFTGVSTDTRTLPAGALFVALRGDRFDGHAFVQEAVSKGARGIVVDNEGRIDDVGKGVAVFRVDDTLEALGLLARHRRREINGPVVAVTGTNGKTATKEMLRAVMSSRWRTGATASNLNNLVGVPLTILGAPDDAQALVIEAGASMPGEIAALRRIIEPTVGVVTNVAAGHLEGFGSEAQVLREKTALLEGVPVAVVGLRPPALAARARSYAPRVITAGTSTDADVHPDRWSLDHEGRAQLVFAGHEGRLSVVGAHQVENAMLALAVGQALDLSPSVTVAALVGVTLPPGRMELRRSRDLLVLHDAYNANPASLLAALETACALRDDRPLVVLLGTMLELGEESERLHVEMAKHVVDLEPALVGAIGAFVPAFERWRSRLGDRLLTAPDAATLGERVAPRLAGRALVLVKGSRGVRMEGVLPHLISD